MIVSKDELLKAAQTMIGDRTDDEALLFLDNFNDTLDAYADQMNWREKYEENDRMWRERYRDRFFGDNVESDIEIEEQDDGDKELTYEQLFEEEK